MSQNSHFSLIEIQTFSRAFPSIGYKEHPVDNINGAELSIKDIEGKKFKII